MIKYDNCKDCASVCEHAGKDREFVCPNGVSCKKQYSIDRQAKAAEDFCNAIRTFADKPENIDNLEYYLSHNFAAWLDKWASTPDDIACEMLNFANMVID